MIQWRAVREVFWPVLESEEPGERREFHDEAKREILNQLEGISDSNVIEHLHGLSRSLYKDEEERRKTIESKATTLMGAIGLTSAILIGFGSLFMTKLESIYPHIIIALSSLYILTIVYFFMSVVNSLKVLGRTRKHILHSRDIVEANGRGQVEYLRSLSAKLIEYTEKNYEVNNRKVDNLVMSQEFFRRGFILFLLLGIIIGGWTLCEAIQVI